MVTTWLSTNMVTLQRLHKVYSGRQAFPVPVAATEVMTSPWPTADAAILDDGHVTLRQPRFHINPALLVWLPAG